MSVPTAINLTTVAGHLAERSQRDGAVWQNNFDQAGGRRFGETKPTSMSRDQAPRTAFGSVSIRLEAGAQNALAAMGAAFAALRASPLGKLGAR